MTTETLGERLTALRKRTGLGSQRVASQRLGLTVNTLWSYENERTLPDIDFLARFAALTGADLAELIRLRLSAGGHPAPDLAVAEPRADYAGEPADQTAIMRALALSAIPREWALLLMQLATAGQLTEAGAKEIIRFFDEWQPDPNWLRHMEAEGESTDS